MKSEHDIRAVALAVVRGVIAPEQARLAVRGRTEAGPVSQTLKLSAELKAEAEHPETLPAAERARCQEVFQELFTQPPADQVLREDEVFGLQLASQRLVQPHEVEECREIQKKLAGLGVHPVPRVGDLLVRRGTLTAQRLAEAIASRTPGLRKEPALTETQFDDISSDALEPASHPENVFGKYFRVYLLAKGGMGEVWKGWDKELRRWVALRFLKCDGPEELARFRREAQIAAKISHPNVAALYEVGEAQGKPFVAMPYVSGQTLATFPREDVKVLVELLRDAALAVHAAHEQGVIHRDLKPGNIMVDGKPGPRPKTERRTPNMKRTQGLKLWVMDFGQVKERAGILGTPAYASPEQAQGTRAPDGRSDVYSLGATLYSVLADHPPFKGLSDADLLKSAAGEDPRPLREVKPESDEDLETIVMKCLEKDPARRYPTALELADDLSRWLDSEPISARPPSALYRFKKFVARRKWPLLVLILLALVLGAVLYFNYRSGGFPFRRTTGGGRAERYRAYFPAGSWRASIDRRGPRSRRGSDLAEWAPGRPPTRT